MMQKRITKTIPVFGGGKRFHWSWKAAFMACVEKVPATAEYKPVEEVPIWGSVEVSGESGTLSRSI